MTAKCEFFHIIQFLVVPLVGEVQAFTERSGKLATIVHFQRSRLGLGLYRSVIWAAGLKKNMGPQQCRRDWAIKTFQRCQNNPARKLRGYEGCHSNVLQLPQLTTGPAANPTLNHSLTEHTQAKMSQTCTLSAARTLLWRRREGCLFASSHLQTAAPASLIHLHLRPVSWDEWGGDRRRDTIRAPCVSTAWIHTSSSKSHLFIQTMLQPMALS